jgi:hypothetical protein
MRLHLHALPVRLLTIIMAAMTQAFPRVFRRVFCRVFSRVCCGRVC